MGATQMHLKGMQWQARWYNGTLQLRNHEGHIWQPNPAHDMGILRSMLEDARMGHMWLTASHHRHGEGIEHGLDLTVSQKRYNWYINQGKMAHAGALMAAFTGALWPGERLGPEDALIANRQIMMSCPKFYTCPKLATCRHPMIVKTQHLGLQPKANTTPTREPYWGAYSLGQGNQLQGWQGHIVMYTDGSGGACSQDPRLRRCGWAWVVNCANAQYNIMLIAYYGGYGSLGDRQTVPRVEMVAVMRALLAVEHNGAGGHRGDRIVRKKGRATLQSVLCTGWEDLWDRLDALTDRSIQVRVEKVMAHTSDDSIAAKEQQAGNGLADHFADKGAICQWTGSEVKPILRI
eukprot:8036103-Karenia_brevis.AAC.1